MTDRLRETDAIVHELKVWPVFYDALATGIKTFEVRFNDRNFKRGHTLRLREWSPALPAHHGGYTGRECQRTVAYVFSGDDCKGFGVEQGYAVLGLEDPRIERQGKALRAVNALCDEMELPHFEGSAGCCAVGYAVRFRAALAQTEPQTADEGKEDTLDG